MTQYYLYCIGAWILVVAFGFAAHLFGRFAQPVPDNPDDPTSVRRARVGVAISITGPIVALLIGSGAAAVTGAWPLTGLVTLALITLTAAVGYVLAPR